MGMPQPVLPPSLPQPLLQPLGTEMPAFAGATQASKISLWIIWSGYAIHVYILYILYTSINSFMVYALVDEALAQSADK